MRNNQPFFKIIVPNYNNMAYIKKCLDSINEQTFKDFVTVVVDDFSSDFSYEFAQMHAAQDPDRFVALRVDKKGYAGKARNTGLEYPVSSKYVMFLDSDDWFADKNVLNRLHKLIISQKKLPEIVRCPLFHWHGDGNLHNHVDNFKSSSISYQYSVGPGPGRACISARLANLCRFKENRAKYNDVIWFLTCLDNVTEKDIINASFPVQVYNRASVTSCQNNSDVMKTLVCLKAHEQLVQDLIELKLKTSECKAIRQKQLKRRLAMYKRGMSASSLMKYSVVVSINQERYNLFNQIFRAHGLSAQIVYGCTDKKIPPVKRCLMAHLNAIKHAKKNNFPYVLVFEDDAYPCNDALDRLDRYAMCIPADANLVLFGWSRHNSSSSQKFDAMYNKIVTSSISGAHAYLVFKDAFDAYIKMLSDSSTRVADNEVFMKIGQSYVVDSPMFIQFTNERSMNNHVGYIFYGDHDAPPVGFERIEDVIQH